MEEKNIFISIYGDPSNWHKVNYNINNNSYSSITSSSAICKEYKIKESIILIPDTLYPYIFKPENTSFTEYSERIKEEFRKHIFQKIEAESDQITKSFICQSELVVFPSLGTFSHNSGLYAFKNDIWVLYYHIYRSLLTKFKEIDNFDTIYVDLTYGINFLEFIFSKSLKYALYSLSVHKRKDYFINYLNSDPFNIKVKSLNIENIGTDSIYHKNSLPTLANEFLSEYKNYEELLAKNFSKLNYLKSTAIMIQNGTIPYLIHIISKINNQFNVFTNLNREVIVTSENGISNITGDTNNPLSHTDLIFTAYIDAITCFYKDIQKKELSTIMLYDVIDNYFGQNPINILLKNELKNIKKMKMTDTFQDVGKYRSDKFSDEKTFKRNFFAHAGLINGLVFIKKYQNNIILEFRDKFNLGDSTKDIDWIVDNII